MPRHSRQEQILQLKAVKRTWGTEFNKQLELGVKSPISRFYKYYQEQSDKAIEIFKRKGSIDAGDMVIMFTNNDYIKLYESLYESVGLRFAKWYAGNFDKFLQKAANPGANVDTWRTTFKSKGAQVAGERISLVQGSAKRNLMNVTRRLMMDDTFIESGYEDKARMLRSKFKQYNQYQAERLVRTEATFIANYATHESAKTIFPGADMQKEWISVNMGDYPRHLPKHKADHRVMDGVVVDFDKPFQVPTINGMENLMVPGDPNGSSYNVINCRCTSAPFPKPGAQAVTELQDLNFGLAGQMAEQSLYDLAEAVQTATDIAIAQATKEVIDFIDAETIEEAENYLLNNKIINTKANYSGLSLEEANNINKVIYKNVNSIKENIDFERIQTIKTVKSNQSYVFRASADGLKINLNTFNKSNLDAIYTDNRISTIEKRIERKLRNIDNYPLEEQNVILENINKWKQEISDLQNVKMFYADNLDEVITHEFGHYVESNVLRNPKNFNLINDFADSNFRNSNNIVWDSTLQARLDNIAFKEGIKVSEYATKNAEEYIAESWIAFTKKDYDIINPELLKIFKLISNGY